MAAKLSLGATTPRALADTLRRLADQIEAEGASVAEPFVALLSRLARHVQFPQMPHEGDAELFEDPSGDAPIDVDVEAHLRWAESGEGEPWPVSRG